MSPTTNSLQALRRLGQSVWYDNMYRALIGSGELQRLIDSGVTGLTSNPTIFEKAVSSGDDYDDSLIEYAKAGLTPEDAFEALAIEDIQAAADLLRPVYEDTGGADGFASLEVNPHLAHDTDGTIQAAERLFSDSRTSQRDDKGARHAGGHPRHTPPHRSGNQHQRHPHILA